MGKKAQKTKELWAAIAEAASSPTIDESGQQESLHPPHPQATTRKRGRPRKIINVVSTEEKGAQQQAIEQQAGSIIAAQSTMENKEEKHEEASASACILRNTKEEGGVVSEEEMQLPKGEPSRCRARRKSKPRKSS